MAANEVVTQNAPAAPQRRMLVVGSSGGIGRSVVAAATERGWTCVGADRHSECHLDLSDRDGLEMELVRLFAERGPFDAVVYAAGVCPVAPLATLDAETLAFVQFVNCDAFILLAKAYAALGAHPRGGGVMVAVSSVSAREGWAGGAAYCASKGALSAAARALDVELAPKRIALRVVEPGHVLTDMFRRGAGRMGVPESAAMKPADLAERILGMVEGSSCH